VTASMQGTYVTVEEGKLLNACRALRHAKRMHKSCRTDLKAFPDSDLFHSILKHWGDEVARLNDEVQALVKKATT
jgi:branched-subunit amino acid aminotransferase/4-amino-4-deoxychorismate lyase